MRGAVAAVINRLAERLYDGRLGYAERIHEVNRQHYTDPR